MPVREAASRSRCRRRRRRCGRRARRWRGELPYTACHTRECASKRWREGKRCDIRISMSKLLEDAIKKVRELPEADQDEAAEMLLSVASKYQRPVRLDDDTRGAIEQGRAQARRGEFVSDKDMDAFFKRHGVKPHGA